ncbi:trihelix transcription factor ASIL1-like [Impatiens glandulifera]|uniref:trihelix transcription factor ASIL1-like n=1 Tax=Impatiens glandulifera TaxID=253017 RepID=UPI001FB1374E|nr:trihelix transcription factor ASIL1-like [Impatiens glandulifera]
MALPPPARHLPFREDCWSEEATSTLVDTWGRRFLELNRGNLRQKDWQEVANMVNSLHGHTKKTRRTDVQCKNRIDTLKKKYKAEKARVSASNGVVSSSWSFFSTLDSLIGSTVANKKTTTHRPVSPLAAVPLRAVVIPQKRPSSALEDSYFRKNYEESDDGSEDLGSSDRSNDGDGDGMRCMAKAIVRFGEIYERIEKEKQRQMIELEKQRMQLMKDLEFERMQVFMDIQVKLEKVKQQSKRSDNL